MSWTRQFLSFARDERVVLLSIGLATFGIVSTIITALALVRDEHELPPPEPKTQYITQDTEDALQLDTLEKLLLEHPSHSIREISTKILCDRAINEPEVIEYLTFAITRPDYEERIQGLRALALVTGQTIGKPATHHMLREGPPLTAEALDGLSRLNNERGYSALVRSLELSVDQIGCPDVCDDHYDEYYLRDMAERFCLMFILELVNKYGASMLVKAKFVEKWLARQDWGENAEERRRNFSSYMEVKNNRIVEIIGHIKHTRRGHRALEKAGLIEKGSPRIRRRTLVIEEDEEGADADAETEAEEGEQALEQQARRTREHSAEERRLRRQHREAMVLNDGTRPVGQDDIIERDSSPT